MGQLFFSSGTTQVDRTLPELLPSYVSVDERKVNDFLNFIRQFSTLVKYVNGAGNPSGNWEVFFKHDLSFLLAQLSEIDLSAIPVLYTRYKTELAEAIVPDETEASLVKLYELNIELASMLQSWYDQIVHQMNLEIRDNEIERLIIEITRSNIWVGALQFEACYQNMWYSFNQNPNNLAVEYLPPIAHQLQLGFEKILLPQAVAASNEGNKSLALLPEIPFGNYTDFENYLDELYRSLYSTASIILRDAPNFLEQSLQQANHDPQIALFLSLWEMMKASKTALNQFTKKHLNYYYGQVLQQRLLPAEADTVFLYFTLKAKATQAFLEKGTSVLAGKTATGLPIEYAFDTDLAVNLGKLVAYKNIYNGTLTGNTKNWTGKLLVNPKANLLPTQAKASGWKTFGNDPTTAQLANVGFAYGSPNLLLSESTRTIVFSFVLNAADIQRLQKELFSLGIPKIGFWSSIKTVFEQAFSVNYTAAKKWMLPDSVTTELMVTEKEVVKPADGTGTTETTYSEQFSIAFYIKVSTLQPAIVPYNPGVHGSGYDSTDPLLRFSLQQEITIPYQNDQQVNEELTLNPYQLLAPIQMGLVKVNYHVEGCKNFVLQNDFSQLKPKNPYAPFGTSPIANNHFYLGNTEVFRKPLSYFLLNINWYDLPNTEHGFRDYYQAYNRFSKTNKFYNSIFKWSAAILVEKKWKPLLGVTDQISAEDLQKKQNSDALKMDRKGELNPSQNLPTSPSDKNIDEIKPTPFYIFEWENNLAPQEQPDPSTKKGNATAANDIEKLINYLQNHLSNLISANAAAAAAAQKKKDAKKETKDFSEMIRYVIHALSLFIGTKRKILATKKQELTLPNKEKAVVTTTPPSSLPPALPLPPWLFEGALKTSSTLELLQFDKINWKAVAPPTSFQAKTLYGDQTQDGFLRFTLAEPSYAFGGALYPQIVSAVANYNVNQILNRVAPKTGNGVTTPTTDKSCDTWIDEIESFFNALQPMGDLIPTEEEKTNFENLLTGAKNMIVAKAKSIQAQQSTTKLLPPPKPAFVPKIKNVTASYGVSESIDLSATENVSATDDKFYHLAPFGVAPKTVSAQPICLLPNYTKQAYLYLGLSDVNAPEILSLLFILNESSGSRDMPLPTIEWTFLNGGKWEAFPNASLKDGTNGFVQTGIIRFNLPEVTIGKANLFADEKQGENLYWLRATVSNYADAVCNVIDVHAQAVTASYILQADNTVHFEAPLPANTITKFAIPPPNIAKVVQPLPSMNGKPEEDDLQYYTRVSERLRHKDRAINAWDFERLVLQLFPQVGIVRCLNHTSVEAQGMKAGTTSIIILPNSLAGCKNSLQVKVNQSVRQQVKAELSPILAPFVQLELRSPSYELLKVYAKVELEAGLDPGHYLQVLNKALIELIAPWQNNYPAINPFETSISYFSIMEFINHQDYIAEVLEMEIISFSPEAPDDFIILEKKFEPLQVKQPWYIISSVEMHQLSTTEDSLLFKKPILPAMKMLKKNSKKKKKIKKKKKKVQDALFISIDLYK
ncbi:MAG: baseplate J/gp47 family protein [Saprospiraceae bacterium]